jgi:hypothetical protein
MRFFRDVFPASLLLAFSTSAGPFHVALTVDFEPDQGQNFGSLFELVDRDGKTVAGAGFMGAYNTQPRSSRRNLHFYAKPLQRSPRFELERLPKPTEDSGVYLYNCKHRLYGRSRNGSDPRLRYWDAENGKWVSDEEAQAYATEVGDGLLSATAKSINWQGEPVVRVPDPRLSFGEYYYAGGMIFVRLHDRQADPPVNRLLAIPWRPGSSRIADLSPAIPTDLRLSKEFVYGFGQLGGKVVVATNSGGFYEFDGVRWRCLIEPDTKTSFQIYTMLNYRDRLWMGQYPTGNLFEYDGEKVRRLKGAPPAWPGSVDRAREAQTLAIYGGEVYCGVWPWGEVWRFDENRREWEPVQRMFSHPEVSGKYRHPYEEQMKGIGGTLNIWGQRITSMIPFGDSLYIGTSAKTAAPFDPKFTFLADGRWRDYGQVHRLKVPGHLSVHADWIAGPTAFEFRFEGGRLTVNQDGRRLGEAMLPAGFRIGAVKDVRWGHGIHGTLQGSIRARTYERLGRD